MRTVTSKDLYKFQWPSNPVVSPDGKLVVYEKTVACDATNDYETHLWLADVNGESCRVLTTCGTRNINPIWSPDGKTISFLSNKSLGTQLWLYSFEDSEARMVTHFKYGIGSIAFSPDGQTIFGTVPVKEEVETFDANKSVEQNEQQVVDEQTAWKNNAKRFDKLYYKIDEVGLLKGLKLKIVSIDLDTGSYKQLLGGNYDVGEITVSSDGRNIAFTAINSENDNPLYNGNLYTISTEGGEVKKHYSNSKVTGPAFSPDGKWIAFIGGDPIHRQLFIIPSVTGEAHCLSDQYPDTLADLSFTDMRYSRAAMKPQWSNDNQFIYSLSTFQGTNEIVRFPLAKKDRIHSTVVGGDRTIFHFSYDGEDTIVAAYSSVNHPGKVAAIQLSEAENVIRKFRKPTSEFPAGEAPFPGKEIRLDDCNDELMSELIVTEPEVFVYSSVDNWKIQGFLLKPANFEPDKKYPVLLDIHGGPHSMHGFTYFHQMQMFSANGFAVLYTNPRGSSGYGKEFTKSVKGAYGDKDMQDILNGVDEALKLYDFLDGERVAVNGISYGGFMTNWLITHTNRFYAAVSEGCISNWVSMYGTSDVCPSFMDSEFLGKTDVEELWKLSPLAYVKNVETPLLIVHAEDDLRCPIEQGEQFYSHIKRQGKEVEFLRFPNSSHALLQVGEPKNRCVRLEEMVQWVSEHLPKYEE